MLAVSDALRAGAAREHGLAVADPVLEVEGDLRRPLRVEAFDPGACGRPGAPAGVRTAVGSLKRLLLVNATKLTGNHFDLILYFPSQGRQQRFLKRAHPRSHGC